MARSRRLRHERRRPRRYLLARRNRRRSARSGSPGIFRAIEGFGGRRLVVGGRCERLRRVVAFEARRDRVQFRLVALHGCAFQTGIARGSHIRRGRHGRRRNIRRRHGARPGIGGSGATALPGAHEEQQQQHGQNRGSRGNRHGVERLGCGARAVGAGDTARQRSRRTGPGCGFGRGRRLGRNARARCGRRALDARAGLRSCRCRCLRRWRNRRRASRCLRRRRSGRRAALGRLWRRCRARRRRAAKIPGRHVQDRAELEPAGIVSHERARIRVEERPRHLFANRTVTRAGELAGNIVERLAWLDGVLRAAGNRRRRFGNSRRAARLRPRIARIPSERHARRAQQGSERSARHTR